MFERRAPAAVVRLFVAVLVGSGGPESRGPSAAATVDLCRRQPLPDVDVGYACDVIVTSSSSDGAVTATTIEVPRDAAALRLTLRRAPASHVTSQTGSGRWTTSLPHLRSVEVGELSVDDLQCCYMYYSYSTYQRVCMHCLESQHHMLRCIM